MIARTTRKPHLGFLRQSLIPSVTKK